MLMILTEVSLCISKSFGFLKGKEIKKINKNKKVRERGSKNVT